MSKKKTFNLIATLLLLTSLIVTLAGCGKSKSVYTVELTDGTTRSFENSSEVLDGFEENELFGEELYIGGTLEVIDQIDEISTHEVTFLGKDVPFATVRFGISHISYNLLSGDNKAIISSLKVGDTVRATGKIEEMFVVIKCTGSSIEKYD